MPYVAAAGALAVAGYTWLNALVEWRAGNRLGGVGLGLMGLTVLALGVYLSFRK